MWSQQLRLHDHHAQAHLQLFQIRYVVEKAPVVPAEGLEPPTL